MRGRTKYLTVSAMLAALGVILLGLGSLINTLETQYRRDERVIRFLTFKQDKYAVEYSEKRRAKLSNKTQEE